MSRKSSSMGRRWPIVLAAILVAALALLGSSCGRSRRPIIVGSKDTTEQVVLGEIVAQHLEQRLGRKVVRNLGLGNTPVLYQALTNGEIGIYPEETGTIQGAVLKEAHSDKATTTLERVRYEMQRLAHAEVMDPLGIDNAWAVVVKKANKIETLSDAVNVKPGWRLGVTRDFDERHDGLAALNVYPLPMSAMMRVADQASLYTALDKGELTMVVGHLTDGALARLDEWRVLRDDKKVFGFYQTCLMARTDVLQSDLRIRPALAELSGKFTNRIMKKLDAEVNIDRKNPAEVAADFLMQVGLK